MFTNPLSPSTSLLRYESLFSRNPSQQEIKTKYHSLKRGFAGEYQLAHLLHSIDDKRNVIVLYNSLFEVLQTEFEIDCILLTTDTAYLLEVKNYTGTYYMNQGDLFHYRSKKQIYNPITQLDRAQFLFKRLLQEVNTSLKVKSYVLFVNKNFVLYGLTPELPLILRPQLERFIQKIYANAQPKTRWLERLAETLIQRRKKESYFERIPSYSYKEMKKGIFCEMCQHALKRQNQFTFLCQNCHEVFTVKQAVLYAIAQYHLLFPAYKIRPYKISEWCGFAVSINTIRKILKRDFRQIFNGAHTYYEFKHKREHIRILSQKYFRE